MSIIKIHHRGSFDNTDEYLNRIKSSDIAAVLNKYGPIGVQALASATPYESGDTADAWDYIIVDRPGYCSIRWVNTHRVNGAPIAVLIQYGHGTGTGGYIKGQDYINPAIRPVFDQIAAEVEREVNRINGNN